MENVINRSKTNITKAVALATIGAMFLSIMAMLAKLAVADSTSIMVAFFRFLVTGMYVLGMLKVKHIQGEHISFKTTNFFGHIVRSAASTGSMYSLFYALNYIPLVNANLLTMTYPLFVLIITALVFRKRNGLISWVLFMSGFTGIVLILKPVHAELFTPAAMFGVLSGFCMAVSVLSVRQLTKYEHTYTIMFYYTLVAFLLSLVLACLDWQTPDRHTLCLMIGVGITGALHQELLIRALAYAPARIPAALMYSSVVFSCMFGWLIWHHLPDAQSLFGIILVCASNILIVTTAKEQ